MELNAEWAWTGLALLVLFTIGYMVAIVYRRMLDDGKLRLVDMLHRQGLNLARAPGPQGGAYQPAAAIRRCAACADKAACDAWLNSDRRGVPEYCPNAEYIEALRAAGR